jgi:hypothetical protein
MALLLLIMYVFPKEPWAMPVALVSTVIFFIFMIWGLKWQRRTNKDVLKKYQQQQLEGQSTRQTQEQEGIKPLLEDVMWNFQTGVFGSKLDFYIAITRYNKEVSGKSIVRLLEEKIECIGAEADFIPFDEDSEEAERYNNPMIHLKADDGVSFTGLELLFKLNNELCPLLADSDTIFFEGINSFRIMNRPSICRVLLGS